MVQGSAYSHSKFRVCPTNPHISVVSVVIIFSRLSLFLQVSFLFSDRGLPDGYRHMNGYGSHTFKLINSQGNPVYCKFHYKVWLLLSSFVYVFSPMCMLVCDTISFCQTDQGIKNLTVEEADRLAATDPDYAIRDLYNAIVNGNFPSWTFYIQVMTFEQAEKYPWNPFDLTKVPQPSFQ